MSNCQKTSVQTTEIDVKLECMPNVTRVSGLVGDYNELINRPSINGKLLEGNVILDFPSSENYYTKAETDSAISSAIGESMTSITNSQIDGIAV